jgi:enterochelin esterase-like enzyme
MLSKPMPVLLLFVLAFAPIVRGQSEPSKAQPSYPFLAADGSASPRMSALRKAVEANDQTAIYQFWSDVRAHGAPLVEPIPNDKQHSLVTFVWRGTERTQDVVVVDGVAVAVGGLDPVNSEMVHLHRTDVWYRTYRVRNDARFAYSLSENDPLQSFIDPNRKSNAVADPLNPKLFTTGQSYFELPDAPSQNVALRFNEAAGKVEKLTFRSTILNNERDVWVYTPRDFQPSGKPYPLLVVLDGTAYTTLVPVPTILDNLISEKRIVPLVAVMVRSLGRDKEYYCSTSFADFVASELVPWMRQHFKATADPRLTVVGGSSASGLAATFIGFQHPAVFGNILSQSGSYWWKPDDDPEAEWLTRQLARSPKLPLQFFVEVGDMEIDIQLNTNRHLRDVLTARGYTVQYREFNGSHTYLNWRGSFADGLVSLIGNEGSGR